MSAGESPPLPHLLPDWPAHWRVRAACTLRAGGVSAPPYESLNLASHVGDAMPAVAENRRRLRVALALPAEPVWLEQVHGVDVAKLGSSSAAAAAASGGALRADAAVTRDRAVVCAVLVADCLPVLLAARDGACVAVAHAGWRGLAAGVLEATVRAMGVPGRELISWLGPAISQPHFEVGEEVRTAFVDHDRTAATAFERNARGRWQCDLYGLARQRLAALGIATVTGGGRCTFSQRENYFSFRRDGPCGRMAALIWLT